MHATVAPDTTPPIPVVTISDRAVLTPRGTVAVMVLRLECELDALDGPDRAYCLALVRDLLAEAGA
jgi:hypothetical protein